jgi:hypothetical protein
LDGFTFLAYVIAYSCSFDANRDERSGKAGVLVTLPMERGPCTARTAGHVPHIRHAHVLRPLLAAGLHICVQP